MHVALFGLSGPYVYHTDSLCVFGHVCVHTGEHLICLTNIAGVKSTDLPHTVELPHLLSLLQSAPCFPHPPDLR